MVTMEQTIQTHSLAKLASQLWTSIILKRLKLWDLKLLHRDPLKWRYLNTKFRENLSSGSEVISGDTDRPVIW
jgi:hypothetical protein